MPSGRRQLSERSKQFGSFLGVRDLHPISNEALTRAVVLPNFGRRKSAGNSPHQSRKRNQGCCRNPVGLLLLALGVRSSNYGAPEGSKTHDDLVTAVALAVRGAGGAVQSSRFADLGLPAFISTSSSLTFAGLVSAPGDLPDDWGSWER